MSDELLGAWEDYRALYQVAMFSKKATREDWEQANTQAVRVLEIRSKETGVREGE